jgi:flagellin
MRTLNTNSVAAKAAIDLSKNTFNLQKSLQSFDVAEITQAIQNVATSRAQNAAASNRLQFAADQSSINKTNLESARSRIFDVDVATESSALARNQVLVQSSTAMLAQANGLSGLALNLLG